MTTDPDPGGSVTGTPASAEPVAALVPGGAAGLVREVGALPDGRRISYYTVSPGGAATGPVAAAAR